MDTILEILSGESYSGIRALADLSMCINLYQQWSLTTIINHKYMSFGESVFSVGFIQKTIKVDLYVIINHA